MNLLKSPLRRAAAVSAGAVLGLGGVVVFAAPAMATHPDVVGVATCVAEDGWKVSWTVTNKWNATGTVTHVISSVDAPVTGEIAVDATLAPKTGKLVGEQLIPAGTEKAKLRVRAKFSNGHADARENLVFRPAEKCAPEPEPEPTTPAPTTPAPTPTTPAPELPEIGEAKPLFDVDCDTMTIGLDNPKDGVEITLLLSTSKGEKRELTVKPGEKKTTKFSANEDFKLTIGVKGVEGTETIEYERPDECTAGSGGGDGELALTGAAAGSIAGGAGALLAIGGALFFVARRRKVKFTA